MTYKSENPPFRTTLKDPAPINFDKSTQPRDISGLGVNPYLGRCRTKDKPIMFNIFGSIPKQRPIALASQLALDVTAGFETDKGSSKERKTKEN